MVKKILIPAFLLLLAVALNFEASAQYHRHPVVKHRVITTHRVVQTAPAYYGKGYPHYRMRDGYRDGYRDGDHRRFHKGKKKGHYKHNKHGYRHHRHDHHYNSYRR